MRRDPERNARLLYVSVLAGAVICYAALGLVLGILPSYVPERLGGSPTAVGLAVGAPALTGLVARPIGGRVADHVGPFVPLVTGACVMSAGAIPAALSASLGVLFASRLAVGAGEGMMMASTVLWLLRLVGPQRRGRALGHIGLANYAGLTLGPLLAQALGGAAASGTVLWVAALLPLLGALTATAVRRRATGANLGGRRNGGRAGRTSTVVLLRQTAPAGVGLLLVNVGYVSVLSFGAAVAHANGTGLATAIVPLFAATIVVVRTAGGSIPDRLGGRATVVAFAGLEALGLLGFAAAATPGLAIAALVLLSVGQALAVPGLGLLALAGVPADDHGAAAGLFFAWFDAGVGLGGPAVGGVASLAGPGGALRLAAGAVAIASLSSLRGGYGALRRKRVRGLPRAAR